MQCAADQTGQVYALARRQAERFEHAHEQVHKRFFARDQPRIGKPRQQHDRTVQLRLLLREAAVGRGHCAQRVGHRTAVHDLLERLHQPVERALGESDV